MSKKMAETEKMSEINPTVEFLYKTMLARERDPHKRRVKPVQPHLLQLDFSGLDNSSDDSDFKVDDDESGDDDDDDDDEDDDDDNDDENGEQDGNEIDDDDGRSSGVVSSKQTNNSLSEDDSQPAHQLPPTVNSSLSTAVPVALQPKIISPSKTPSEETALNSVSSKKMKVLICSVCLKDAGQSNDEILECDSCSVLVHEGCYGTCDSLSVVSSESSASMEPWFCDACRAGVKPHCELCPNSGGVYKETDAGRWVHLVCALYVPGVAFGDVSKLNNITLFEMSYSKWGARECSLCEDERFSRTGVCISCDAGMCRTYFHVTCAQREGLLMEAAPDEEIADPFYAYCKQHAEKGSMRLLRRNCLALQSYMKNVEIAREKDETGKLRLQQKLHLHQQKYQEIKELGPPGWVPREKLPRMLLTSANALRQLLKKAELLGHHVQEDRSRDIRKKWHAPPALNIDFVSYFLDRNEHISKMKAAIGELNTQKDKLQVQEKCLHAKYDELSTEMNQISTTNVELQQSGEKLWNCLCDIYGRRLRIPDCVSFRNVVKSPAKKDSATKSPTAFIHCCSFCKKTSDQHLLAKCDKCRQFIHLGCLNPPLTRMPKKTKQQGWQCSQCASPNMSDGDFPDVDPDQPRQLREKTLIRGPMKYTAQFSEFTTRKETSRLKKRKDAKSLLRVHKRPGDNGRGAEPAAKLLKFSPSKDGELALKCARCNVEAAEDSVVVCDRCRKSYHFGCLHPAQSKSPKVQGTDWRCEDCQDEANGVVKETGRSDEDVGRKCRPSDSGPRKFRLLASAFAAKKDRTLASTRTRRKVSLSWRAMENIAYQQKSTFASGRNGHLGKKKELKSDSFGDGGNERATGDAKLAKLSPSTAVKVSPNALQSVENAVKRSQIRSILRSVEKSPTKASPTKTPPKPAVSDTAKYDTQTVIEISDDDDSCQ